MAVAQHRTRPPMMTMMHATSQAQAQALVLAL
eukprot:COSAG06_NODE_39099_length_416_cov_1.085174_1_plen_31_part_10